MSEDLLSKYWADQPDVIRLSPCQRGVEKPAPWLSPSGGEAGTVAVDERSDRRAMEGRARDPPVGVGATACGTVRGRPPRLQSFTLADQAGEPALGLAQCPNEPVLCPEEMDPEHVVAIAANRHLGQLTRGCQLR